MKKALVVVTGLMMAFALNACSAIPKDLNDSPKETTSEVSSETTVAETTSNENKGTDLYNQIKNAKDSEKERELVIKKVRMQAQVDDLMKMPPMMSAEEKAQAEIEDEQKRPFTEASKDMIDYCKTQTNNALSQLIADYPSSAYTENAENRKLEKICSGDTSLELNGGVQPVQIGSDIGYWRFTNCTYYNTVFYTNGESNFVESLYRCTAYHYVMNESNLVGDAIPNELTTENSTVTELNDVFLVVNEKDVKPLDIKSSDDSNEMSRVVLMFNSYEDVINSFSKPKHTFTEQFIGEDFNGTIIDGYLGTPIVTMPELVGKFIDVAKPNNVKELDDLHVTNYKVEWVDNDGSQVPYSILSTNKETGTYIDITDKSDEATIVVQVASKPSNTAAE